MSHSHTFLHACNNEIIELTENVADLGIMLLKLHRVHVRFLIRANYSPERLWNAVSYCQQTDVILLKYFFDEKYNGKLR